MKKSIYFVLTIILLFSFICCNKKKDALIDSGQEIIITGMISECFENNICIVENWTSRSAVSNLIENIKLNKKLANNMGKIATVKCLVVDEQNQWNRTIKILAVTNIEPAEN